jgi:hypothetical protein
MYVYMYIKFLGWEFCHGNYFKAYAIKPAFLINATGVYF